MKLTVTAAKLFQWIEDDMRLQKEVPLIYLRDQKWYQEFFEHNKKAFDEVVELRMNLAKEYFEMDENGEAKMTPQYREETVVVKKKTRFSKEVTETKQVQTGNQPVLNEGKTLEGYHQALNELKSSQYEVNTKPKIYSKFPIIVNL